MQARPSPITKSLVACGTFSGKDKKRFRYCGFVSSFVSVQRYREAISVEQPCWGNRTAYQGSQVNIW